MDCFAAPFAPLVDTFLTRGFVVLDNALPDQEVAGLLEALAKVGAGKSARRRGTSTYGVRNLLHIAPAAQALARSPALRTIVDAFAGPAARPVRGIYFDKTPEANWRVAWHQDLAIAVRERREIDGWSGWSLKDGVPNVQPPAEILASMLTVRVHLDDADRENGALRVIPGSHQFGRLDAAKIRQLVDRVPAEICAVKAGGVVVMRPLLLHASSSADVPSHRRVVHIEYSSATLPDGLAWHGS